MTGVDRGPQNALTELLLARASHRDNLPDFRTFDAKASFRRHVEPLMKLLLSDPSFVKTLAPAFQVAVLDELTQLKQTLDEIRRNVGSLAGGLKHLKRMSRDQLEALATRFEIDAVYNLTEPQLRDMLEDKAHEYRALSAQIDALDDRVADIANIKRDVQEAAARLDFDEVETLLSHIDGVETEIAAETKVARAQNALLRNRPKDAFQILSAAADSFGSSDLLRPARQKIQYHTLLRKHGADFGYEALQLASKMLEEAIEKLRSEDRPDVESLWLAEQNYGQVLVELSDRSGVPERIELLKEATAIYTGLLKSYEQESGNQKRVSEEFYYTVCFSLGRAENSLACCKDATIRSEFADAVSGLTRAINHMKLAGDYFAKAKRPHQLLLVTINLGNAHKNYGRLVGGDIGKAQLTQSISMYRLVISGLPPEIHFREWVSQKRNLAAALTYQAILTDGPDGSALIKEAREIYEELIDVCPKDKYPILWGELQFNTSFALVEFSGRSSDTRQMLEAARNHVVAAMSVFDPIHSASDHQKATLLFGEIKARIEAYRD